MIILGIVLAILGYWLLPDLLPEAPARIDNLIGTLGIIFVIIGVILLILSLIGRPVGGRRYWY
jgi:multisubunit Na+/H+ antiporter MnhG subunit